MSARSGAGRAAAEHRARWGQFFTPPAVAALMAGMARVVPGAPLVVLDPGAGEGALGAALARRALAAGAREVRLIAVEAEPGAQAALARTLDGLCAELGERVQVELRTEDFLAAPVGGPADVVIANPPWRKMSPADPRGGDAPNAYARFMEVALGWLRPGRQALFIVPRSFASGAYFCRFRGRFFSAVSLDAVHLFESRRGAFGAAPVLQETVILDCTRGTPQAELVRISRAAGLEEPRPVEVFQAPIGLVRATRDPAANLHLPASEAEARALRRVSRWPERLASLGLRVSTGPVVPFRTRALAAEPGPDTAPLLWMQHLRDGAVRWPLGPTMRKPEHLRRDAGPGLLVPNQTLVLLRRFSAKEDPRRLSVAVLDAGALPGPWLGLENHLNYIHQPGGRLERPLAWGLGALLASTLLDAWLRALGGNTQISASELRTLPLPAREELLRLGQAVLALDPRALPPPEQIDALVDLHLPDPGPSTLD